MNQPNDSILASVKKMLGLDEDYTPFDMEIMMDINGAIMKLGQLGVGPKTGYTVTDYTQTWVDFLGDDKLLSAVPQYIYMQVKMVFDPPTNSHVMTSMQQQVEELGWRLNVQAESQETFGFMTMDEAAIKRTTGSVSE